jgi:hypothetical protein
MKTKKKNQKPIDVDAHFKYRCPKSSCGYDHWLSLKQVGIKNFKVVCDCGTVFKPRTIKRIKIVYENITKKQPEIIEEQPKNIVVQKDKIPIDLQKKCSTLLHSYGFTNAECIELTEKAYDKNPTDDIGSLVKYIIQNLGELNEFH